MFKILFASLTVLLALGSFSAHAQMADRLSEHPTFNKSAMKESVGPDAVALTREMTIKLHLNEAQILNLLALNRTKLAGLKNINQEYKDDEATRAAKTAELESQFEQECSRVLTPSQLSQLHQETEHPTTAPGNSGNGLG
ncbi:hypothetical protein Q3A66_05245 [Hymenobacter sp. BT770]|uniref:hypothetical protein n=1 Tax=Hymenobacter sp. BT770 TaxID=2886942 RepID=UPI001D10E415|nr:hypothetical protein [Hymenobacter sp. BT770]MCC3152559.1 hypothetical protein [Hymenobacter sp. BT770]MDO3414464.1 hypothetical protein [Hymenobacter sp. BT770]